MYKILLACVLTMTAAAPAAQASLLQLDFSGQIVANFPDDGAVLDRAISGQFILDPTLPDNRPQADNAQYLFPVLDGSLVFDGVTFEIINGIFNDVYIINDNATTNDLFALVIDLQGTNGEFQTLSLQFGDMTQTVFSDDSFPLEFDLAQFDEFEIGNTLSTGIFLAGFGGNSFQGGFDSAQLRALPMPNPGTVVLCVTAFLAWRLTRLRPQ